MVVSDGIRNVFQQHRLTCLRLCHDKSALSFSDWGKKVHDPGAQVFLWMTRKLDLFVWKKRREVVEDNAVTHKRRIASVDLVDLDEREIFLTLLWRANAPFYNV